MKAKEYLNQAYRLNDIIRSDFQELEDLENIKDKICSPILSGLPTAYNSSNDNANYTSTVEKIVELQNKIRIEIDRLIDLRTDIRDKIALVPNKSEHLVLKYRYIDFMTWEQIAVEMHYSFQWIHKIHQKALKNFDKIILHNQ